MASKAEIESAYNSILAGHQPVQSSGQANDAFEVCVLALALKAARAEGADISFETNLGNTNPNPIIFRTSPGRIYSTSKEYTHALVSFDSGYELEAHVGVYAQGTAGVLHECDVLIVERDEALFCRRANVHPKRPRIPLAVECKFYTGNLGIAMARQFLGVTLDVGKDDRFFVSNSDSSSVDKVLAHHKRQRFFGLTPRDKDTEAQLIGQFRTTFKNKLAKYR